MRILFSIIALLSITAIPPTWAAEIELADFTAMSGSLGVPFSRLTYGTTLNTSRDYDGEDRFFPTRKANVVTGEISAMITRGGLAAKTDAQMHVLEIGSGTGKSTATILDYIITSVANAIELHAWDDWGAYTAPATVQGQSITLKSRVARTADPAEADTATTRSVPNDIQRFLSNVLIESHLQSHDMAAFTAALKVVYGTYDGETDESNADTFLLGTTEFPEQSIAADEVTIGHLTQASKEAGLCTIPNLNAGEKYGLIYLDTDTTSTSDFKLILRGAWNSLSDRGSLVIDDYGWSPDGGTNFPIQDSVNAFVYENFVTIFSEYMGGGSPIPPTDETDFVDSIDNWAATRNYHATTGETVGDFAGNEEGAVTSDGVRVMEFHQIWSSARPRWMVILRRGSSASDIVP